MYAAELNGYSIIAEAITDHERGLILGESYRDDRLIYVVSFAPHPDTDPSYWHNGRYFDGPDSSQNETEARQAFLALLSASWEADRERKAELRRNASLRAAEKRRAESIRRNLPVSESGYDTGQH